MSIAFDELEKQARALSLKEKATLARLLIEELDTNSSSSLLPIRSGVLDTGKTGTESYCAATQDSTITRQHVFSKNFLASFIECLRQARRKRSRSQVPVIIRTNDEEQ